MTRGEISFSSGDNDPVTPGSCFSGAWRELGWLIEIELEWKRISLKGPLAFQHNVSERMKTKSSLRTLPSQGQLANQILYLTHTRFETSKIGIFFPCFSLELKESWIHICSWDSGLVLSRLLSFRWGRGHCACACHSFTASQTHGGFHKHVDLCALIYQK